MFLSNETVEILKNFSMINPTLLIQPGNVIKTIHSKKTIFGYAKVKETFPQECAINDLTKLIMVLSAYDKPEITFSEKNLTISNDMWSTKIIYGGTASVTHPPSKIPPLPSIDASYTINNQALSGVLRLTAGLGLPNIILYGRNGKSYFAGTNVMEDICDGTEYEVGPATNDYKAIFELENMKLLPRDYTVDVTNGMAHFKSTTGDIEYYVACSTPKNPKN